MKRTPKQTMQLFTADELKTLKQIAVKIHDCGERLRQRHLYGPKHGIEFGQDEMKVMDKTLYLHLSNDEYAELLAHLL